ncbi:MAG: hypothetical protein ABI743_07275, partial [bacterium]
LQYYRPLDAGMLLGLLVTTTIWVGAVFALRRHSTLNDAALFCAALVGYLTWLIGGWSWDLAPVLVYGGYTFLWPRPDQIQAHPHEAYTVVAIAGPGLLLLIAAAGLHHPEWLLPYSVYWAIQLAMLGLIFFRETRPDVGRAQRIWRSSVVSWALVLSTYVIVEGASTASLLAALGGLAATALAMLFFDGVLPPVGSGRSEPFPWLMRSIIGVAGALLGSIALGLGGV